MTFIFVLTFSSNTLAKDFFDLCQEKVLAGKNIDYFITQEKEALGEEKESSYLKDLEKLKKERNCFNLLRYTRLAENGLLINRTPLASQILSTFDNFHTDWLTPTDLDRNPQCQDQYLDDFFDPQSPAYHLTRALFQEGRKAAMSITAYGDLRVVTKGENPKESQTTGLSKEKIKEILELDNDFEFKGEGEVIGYLYQRRLHMGSKPYIPEQVSGSDSWADELKRKAFKTLDHLGAGLIGNSRFLVHYAHPEAFSGDLLQFDGTQKLPRRLAKGIVENLLCTPLKDHPLKTINPSNNWNHPLTAEKKCLNCHQLIDPLAAGLRHLTYVKNQKECSQFQILIPKTFDSKGPREIWQKSQENTDPPFHLSHPIGYLEEERFIGINQLGKLLSNHPKFYQCQVKKYLSFFGKTDIPEQTIQSLAASYQDHQNGLKLLNTIIDTIK